MMKRLSILMAFLGVFTATMAQKEVTVEGEYTYYIPSYQSKDEALIIAFNRARNAALIAEFNQTLFQSNATIVSNRNGKSTVDFYSFSSSDVRGIWLGDDKTDTTISCDPIMKEFVVIAKVKGLAREIKSAGIEIDTRVLRNRWEEQYEGYDFISGDSIYLYFRAPVDGYVTVWLFNHYDQTVSCLLPYVDSQEGAVKVKQNKEYVFFHRDYSMPDYNQIEEYILNANGIEEINDIYIVFSPNTYTRPIVTPPTDKRDLGILSFKKFNAWLIKCRSKDLDMTVVTKQITIKREQ